MKNALIIWLLLFALNGCESFFLGKDESDDPVNNFEIFWQDFDQHYGLFLARGWNWDSIYQVMRPQVNAQTSEVELWAVFRRMIRYLDDGHTFILNPRQSWYFSSGSEERSTVTKEFSLDLVKKRYIENYRSIPNTGSNINDEYIFANVRNRDIGYIYLNGIEATDVNFMDYVLTRIGKHKAIILDLRNNNGGDDCTAEQIAGRFADGEHFIYTVQERCGPGHDNFTEKKKYYTRIRGKEHFSGPLVVLTDRNTISASETLLLHLKSFSQTTQIGDTTSGDFSDVGMRRFLPNGWQYRYSIMMFLLPDGRSLDGIGHAPDIQARNSVADIQAENDLVLEKAIEYLYERYSID